jgi:hypothetical protein
MFCVFAPAVIDGLRDGGTGCASTDEQCEASNRCANHSTDPESATEDCRSRW